MRKYDKHSLSSSALLAKDYRRVTASSWALISCIYHFTTESSFLQKDCFPAASPRGSYSETLQLQLPCLVARTVLCLAAPPGPHRPGSSGPPRLGGGRAAAAGRGHAHVGSTGPGRRPAGGARRGGRRPRRAAGLPPLQRGRGEPPPFPGSRGPPPAALPYPPKPPCLSWLVALCEQPQQPALTAGYKARENEVEKFQCENSQILVIFFIVL